MPPMNHAMMDGAMAICMIACTLFALVIVVAVIIQTVVQVKLLAEIRKLHGAGNVIGQRDISPRP